MLVRRQISLATTDINIHHRRPPSSKMSDLAKLLRTGVAPEGYVGERTDLANNNCSTVSPLKGIMEWRQQLHEKLGCWQSSPVQTRRSHSTVVVQLFRLGSLLEVLDSDGGVTEISICRHFAKQVLFLVVIKTLQRFHVSFENVFSKEPCKVRSVSKSTRQADR